MTIDRTRDVVDGCKQIVPQRQSVERRVAMQVELWKQEGVPVTEWGWKEGSWGPL